jgi:predicted PurR-regulated permease PerM
MRQERLVDLRAGTVIRTLAIIIAAALALEIIWIARQVISWIVIALFLALALDPLVSLFERRAKLPRGWAIGAVYISLTLVLAAIGATFLPSLIHEVNGLANALPGYIHDLTHGRGRLGFLETKYHIVEKVKAQVQTGGATKLLGISGTALSITQSVITAVAATVTIIFLTFFMLLEGRAWTERLYGLLPEEAQPRWRAVGADVYRTVGGYVSGNLLISLIAGTLITIVLLILGVPFAVALGLLVGVLDLIPLAGATLAGIVVVGVAALHSVLAAVVVAIVFVIYQQIENHILQPMIYSRTVQLSPLAVLLAVLVGASLAGILGALAAIPVAGTIQVILRDWLTTRATTTPAAGSG